jgi:Zn-dependent oligopeptidase
VLERFGSTSAGLAIVGKHYETGEKIPKKLLSALDYNSKDTVFAWQRQFAFGLFDISLHGKEMQRVIGEPLYMHDLFESVFKDVTKVPYTGRQEYVSGFAHIMHGYQSKYYSYVVSKVYADDVWGEFVKAKLKKSESVFKRYKEMLEKGTVQKEWDTLKEFLRRTPNQDAFIKMLTGK